MNTSLLAREFNETARKELKRNSLELSSEADSYIQDMIENAVNNLIKRKNQLNQSDAEFNQGVKDALNKLRTSVIEEVAREYNEYEYYGTAKPSISPSTVLKVKEKICPLFPFC